MSITPIVQTVAVKAAPPRAFELFVTRMADWWPKGMTIGKAHVDIVIEPRVEGRWFERDAEGNEVQWGKVLAWEPPSRLLLAWQIDSEWRYDPTLVTEVELTFAPAPAPGGGTIVTLQHRNLKRFGRDAVPHSERLRGGWPRLVARFAELVDSNV